MEMDTPAFNLLAGEKHIFEGVSYSLNMQCGVPIVLIDLVHNRSSLNSLCWSKLLSLTEVSGFQQKVENIQNLPIERMTGRLAAKLALLALTGKVFTQVEILASQSEENKGQPYSSCGRCISISHSGQYVVASAADFSIGIDIQKTKSFGETAMKLAFRAEEVDRELKSPTLIWAIKESFLKALGLGVFPYIQSVEVKSEKQLFSINISSPYIENKMLELGNHMQIIAGSFPSYSYSLSKIN